MNRILKPEDIAAYVYCPYLYKRQDKELIVKPFTFLESCMKKAFIEGEGKAVLRDSVVTPNMLARAWDKIWFPAATKRGISMKNVKDKTLHATIKFADYCKYDVSDYTFPTAGVDIQMSSNIGRHVLQTKADLVKIDMTTKKKTTVLVNFTTQQLDNRSSSFDVMARVTAYAFYRGKGEDVSHIYVNIDEKKEKLSMVTSTFTEKDMEVIRKMLYHVETGIANKSFYHNPYKCMECNRCPNISL